ncbi:MAG: hypothetical protein IJC17_01765 [Clostridia bacterium]|nr:hypothetical protein [Clostridia bacterium]
MYKQVPPLPTPAPLDFDAQQFVRPDREFAVSYNWSWTMPLSYDSIRHHIDAMAEGGMRSLCVIPQPPEFRPEMSPTYLSPPYLSDDYLEMYRFAVEYALSKGLTFWMYDEAGWPSGMANGLTCKEHPELRCRNLKQETRTLKAGEAYVPAEDAVAAFSLDRQRLAAGYTPVEDEEIWEYQINYPKWLNNDYPDLLNPKSAERFLKVTHDRYNEAMPDLFGNEIRYFFTDEPEVPGPAWSEGTEEQFKAIYGYDLLDYLPALFSSEDLSEREQQARIDYFDWWAKRYAENYLGQLQSWCHEHHMLSVGHVGGDDVSDGSGKYSYKSIMRALRKFDVPGVDAIMQQITNRRPQSVYYRFGDRYIPIAANHFFPRFASSAAAQTGSRYSLTETFGVYGPGGTTGFEEMRYAIGFQLVRGINVINCMSMGNGREGTGVAGVGGGNIPEDPSYVHLKGIYNSITRQCYALSLGDPVVEVGLYLPIRDQWASVPLREATSAAFDAIGYKLEGYPCPFDVVDDDFFGEAAVADGALTMGLAKYKTIVLPECTKLLDSSREKLEAFIAAGGKVVQVCDQAPTIAIKGAKVVALDALEDEIAPVVQILALKSEEEPVHEDDPSVRVLKRALPNGATLYYVFNESMGKQDFTLRFNESKPCYRLDTEIGKVRRLSDTPICREEEAGQTDLVLSLCSGESAVILFTEAELESIAEDPARVIALESTMELTEFTASRTMMVKIGDPALEVRYPTEVFQPMKLGDWRAVYGDDFSGRAEYDTTFALPENWKAGSSLVLSLGEVKHSCEVFVNGKSQGILYAHPYRLTLDSAALKPENHLKICVANTSADQHAHAGLVDRWPANILGPYYDTSVKFSEPMRGGGLIGPVTLTVV